MLLWLSNSYNLRVSFWNDEFGAGDKVAEHGAEGLTLGSDKNTPTILFVFLLLRINIARILVTRIELANLYFKVETVLFWESFSQ